MMAQITGDPAVQNEKPEKIFDQLYEKVITGSITDEEMYEPGMINEIFITITKNNPKRLSQNRSEYGIHKL